MTDKEYTELYKKGISEPQPVLKPEDILTARIYKVLCKCRRNQYKPDLHSFWITTAEEGPVFVDYLDNEVIISGADNKWVLPIEEAATKLAFMGADPQTIDM
jgi:hypothetical protein